ncbi:hypothetical protein BDV38DRAFT_259316 [Aspergillus pseudotamarii]|uniref:Uncharacterized protein n=1 Tax=Aspergillus pseudotamarii TaxID=132259 RepID=A0A5N6SJ64_ASPPS|nr:uncharacterized protein BDV38DRAFT_259316 [Aspergillus pseudotamarii]KAE8133134.1 hypothetical protein BDV38DRAFT_259316 [Aspergillus pseudotamarii]
MGQSMYSKSYFVWWSGPWKVYYYLQCFVPIIPCSYFPLLILLFAPRILYSSHLNNQMEYKLLQTRLSLQNLG